MHDSMFKIPDLHKKGNIDKDKVLRSKDNFRDAAIELAGTALKSINILTPNMEPEIYDNQLFLDNLLRLCRGNRHARVKILVSDSSWAVKHGHGVVRLSQKLTTAMEIRIPVDEYLNASSAFMVVDTKGLIFRQEIDNYRGIYNSECLYRAKHLDNLFTNIWEHSEEDIQLKKLYI